MRRKRLKNTAFTLCHMFCGWRLLNCYKEMISLGSGELLIDVPSARCQFNGTAIPSLSIAHELESWYRQELAANKIPVEGIRSATLSARLELQTIDRKRRRTASQYFAADGMPIRSPKLYQCQIECESKIITDETEYQARFADIEEWPEDFY